MGRNMKNSLKGARVRPNSTNKEYVKRRLDAFDRGKLSYESFEKKFDDSLDLTLKEKVKLIRVLSALLDTASDEYDNDAVVRNIVDSIEKDGIDPAMLTVLGYNVLMFVDVLANMLEKEKDKMESEKR